MIISVSGHQMDTGESFTQHCRAALTSIGDKYAERLIDARVSIHKDTHLYKVDVTLRLQHGVTLHAHAKGETPYLSFDESVRRLDGQLHKRKARIQNYYRTPRPFRSAAEMSMDADAEDTGDFLVIAEGTDHLSTASVSEAVSHMLDNKLSAYVFRNAQGTVNVVYKRPDENIGWIDCQEGISPDLSLFED